LTLAIFLVCLHVQYNVEFRLFVFGNDTYASLMRSKYSEMRIWSL